MHYFARFDAALGASSDLLSEVLREIGDVIEMEVSSAEATVCVTGHGLFGGAEAHVEGIFFGESFTRFQIAIVHLLPLHLNLTCVIRTVSLLVGLVVVGTASFLSRLT